MSSLPVKHWGPVSNRVTSGAAQASVPTTDFCRVVWSRTRADPRSQIYSQGSEMKETLKVSVSACSGHKCGNQFTCVFLVIAVSEFGGMYDISR